jgi:hypothetical protein
MPLLINTARVMVASDKELLLAMDESNSIRWETPSPPYISR